MMGSQNSLVEAFGLSILRNILDDLGEQDHRTASDTEHDWQTIATRVASEGYPFMTSTMSSLARSLDQAIATDTPLVTTGFQTRQGLPVFMGDYWRAIFDEAGMLREHPSQPQFALYVRSCI